MGRKVKYHANLLEHMFSRAEWEYLKRNPKFQKQMESISESLNEIDKIAALGDQLLFEWENRNPRRAKFKRLGRRRS